MAKFRVRNLLTRFPVLDAWRLSFLAGFCHHGINFIDNLYTITKYLSPATQALFDEGKPVIFAMYHGRMIGLLRLFKPRERLSVLVSQSRDGEIIARALSDLGFTLVRGGTGRGAVQGSLQMLKAAEAGQNLVFFVDGPRGPLHEVKSGVIRVAELTGLPIVPFVCSARTYWKFWGWDKFMGTHVGGEEVFIYGDPIYVERENPDDDSRERSRTELQDEMARLREIADGYWAVYA